MYTILYKNSDKLNLRVLSVVFLIIFDNRILVVIGSLGIICVALAIEIILLGRKAHRNTEFVVYRHEHVDRDDISSGKFLLTVDDEDD